MALEVVIGVSIAAVILTVAGNAMGQFINTGRSVTQKTQALYLAEEGLELIRFVRDTNWADVSVVPTDTTRYLSVTPTTVVITTTPEIIEGFVRSFRFQNVYRNATTDDIVASTTAGAVVDTSAKYVTVSVSYGNPTTTVSLTSVLADLDP
jgi:type II secretory pathway pseudopilin PulG